MIRFLILVFLFPALLGAQPACIGIQINNLGEVKILLPNEPAFCAVGDSVYYIKENDSSIIKTTVNEFTKNLQLVKQQDYLEQVLKERKTWPFHEVKAPKPQFKEPIVGDNFQDYFWPDSTLTLDSKVQIRKMLKAYVLNNYNVNGCRSGDMTWSYSSVKEAIVYEYVGKQLTGVISYNEENIPILYDQLYYNFLGQLILVHRKKIGEIGGSTYTFHYDENKRLYHLNEVHAGCFREGYEEPTVFSFKYFKYDKSGQLSAIVQQGKTSKPLRIVKWKTKAE